MHVWDALDLGVWQGVPVPDDFQPLHTEEWDNIPQAIINSLIHSVKEMSCFLRQLVVAQDTDPLLIFF